MILHEVQHQRLQQDGAQRNLSHDVPDGVPEGVSENVPDLFAISAYEQNCRSTLRSIVGEIDFVTRRSRLRSHVGQHFGYIFGQHFGQQFGQHFRQNCGQHFGQHFGSFQPCCERSSICGVQIICLNPLMRERHFSAVEQKTLPHPCSSF